MAQDTVFDMILAKKIPANVVHEDEHVLAFRDIMPQAPVHVIVIPKKKVGRLAELVKSETTDVGEFFKRVALVAQKLKLDEKGYRVVVNNGADGGQTVEYLHAHILGGRALTWPPG